MLMTHDPSVGVRRRHLPNCRWGGAKVLSLSQRTAILRAKADGHLGARLERDLARRVGQLHDKVVAAEHCQTHAHLVAQKARIDEARREAVGVIGSWGLG